MSTFQVNPAQIMYTGETFNAEVLRFDAPAHPTRGNYLHILSALRDKPWAITAAALRTMNDIVERPVADLEAVAAKRGMPMDKDPLMQMRDSVAVLGIEGPVFRYANLMTALSGATSIQQAALAFNAAVENPKVSQIVLHINSPGGEVDGVSSFADQIRAAADKKPVTAFVDGLGASAAYWLASAASRIVADESSRVGSIGVVATVTDRRDAQERQGVKTYEIISSQSPAKRPDPATDEGRAQIQQMVDETADMFIGRVAQFRGVTPEKVMADFGGGRTLTASAALNAGMIDQMMPFETFMRSLDAPAPTITQPATAPLAVSGEIMSTAIPSTDPPAAAALPSAAPPNLVTPPAINEKDRIRAILLLPEAQQRQKQARHIALDTDLTIVQAQALLQASPEEAAPVASATSTSFERMMSQLPQPKVGQSGAEVMDDDSPAAEAARVLRFVSDARKIKAA